MEQNETAHFPDTGSKTQYIVTLAKELIDDIELSRIPVEAILLKTMRLARFAGSEEMRKWIACELGGYDSRDPIAIKYMTIMGRWTDYQKNEGYWYPLAQMESYITTMRLRIGSLRVPDISYSASNPNNLWMGDQLVITGPIKSVLNEANSLNDSIAQLSGIRSRVVAHLYAFAMRVHHEKMFSGLTESIFERYKNMVDARLSVEAGDVLEKIPAIYNRLAEGDRESISQAQNTCRRVINAFADAVYPPTDEVIQVNGKAVTLSKKDVRARINQYVRQKTQSQSRQDKLRQTLTNLYNRLSTAVHNEVSLEEAQSLFLQTYLFMGEVLTLGEPPT